MAFHNILFPVDFSEPCEAIVPHVRSLCARFHASLTLAHFVYIPSMAYGAIDAAGPIAWPVEDLTENAERRLSTFSAKFFPGMNARTVVRQADPAAGICELAESNAFDLIMMPTHGYGRLRALLVGSVTSKILHDATCAVWTASHRAKQRPSEPWKRIICAIDTDDEGKRLLRKAMELSENGKGSVRVVHSVPPPVATEDLSAPSTFLDFLLKSAEDVIVEMQSETGTTFESHVRPGFIPHVVREEATEWNADLVLIGRGILPRFAGQFRSHAYSIIRTMPCPVLSI